MIKQLIFALLIALIVSQDLCPSKLAAECEQDLELGKYTTIQQFNHVKRLLNKKALIRLQTSTVSSFSSLAKKIAGPASA